LLRQELTAARRKYLEARSDEQQAYHHDEQTRRKGQTIAAYHLGKKKIEKVD
jgi:hypothetical protein